MDPWYQGTVLLKFCSYIGIAWYVVLYIQTDLIRKENNIKKKVKERTGGGGPEESVKDLWNTLHRIKEEEETRMVLHVCNLRP